MVSNGLHGNPPPGDRGGRTGCRAARGAGGSSSGGSARRPRRETAGPERRRSETVGFGTDTGISAKFDSSSSAAGEAENTGAAASRSPAARYIRGTPGTPLPRSSGTRSQPFSQFVACPAIFAIFVSETINRSPCADPACSTAFPPPPRPRRASSAPRSCASVRTAPATHGTPRPRTPARRSPPRR